MDIFNRFRRHETRSRFSRWFPAIEQLESRLLLAECDNQDGFQYPLGETAYTTQYFGWLADSKKIGHLGHDFSLASGNGDVGKPVYAAADGEVTYVGKGTVKRSDGTVVEDADGWGEVVIIKHTTTEWNWNKDVYGLYAHLGSEHIVTVGDSVRRGDEIGELGKYDDFLAHLHFEIRYGDDAAEIAGPGYSGQEFDRGTYPSISAGNDDLPIDSKFDHYEMTWYDPFKVISENYCGVFEELHGAAPANVDFPVEVGGGGFVAGYPVIEIPQSPPGFAGAFVSPQPAFVGEIVAVEAFGFFDPDGDLARFDVFLDANDDLIPDDNELVDAAYFRGDVLRTGVSTEGFGIGTHTLLVQLVDSRGNRSEVRSTSLQIVDPGAPPPALPTSIDASIQADFRIVPHRNGHVEYDENYFSLRPGQVDFWELTPHSTGNFNLETTGSTDTAIGIYDHATRNLVAFDEDNGLGGNAELTASLNADQTYFIAVASQNGSSGNYGMNVTGTIQTLTATVSPQPIVHSVSQAGSITQPNHIDYFQVIAPPGTTAVDIRLEVSASLNGWIRIADAANTTLARTYLAGRGVDDVLRDVPVSPGSTYIITVTALDGAIGAYTLHVDFNPDDLSLPDQLVLPQSYVPLILHPQGEVYFPDEQIASAGELRYFIVSPRQTGDYNFETLGRLDTEIGLYRGNGEFIQRDDDAGDGFNGKTTATLTGGDDYIIVVRAESNSIGSFALKAMGPTEPVGQLNPSGLDSTVSTNFDSISSSGRYLHYQTIAPINATSLSINTEIATGSPSLDIQLLLWDSNGQIIATANAQGPGTGEQIISTAVNPGSVYFVTVYGLDQTTGMVKLDVNFDPNFGINPGLEFLANSTTLSGQEFPAVSRNANGESVIVWSNSDFNRLDGLLLDANGQPIGGELRINQTDLTGISSANDVAMAADGAFAPIWTRDGNLYLRLFNGLGNPITGDVRVNSVGSVSTAKIAISSTGQFVVVWSNSDHGDPDGGIYAQRYSSTGVPIGSEIHVNSTTAGNQYNPDVVFSPDGSFVVVWQSDIGSPNGTHIRCQGFDVNGNPVGSEFQISTGTNASNLNPRIASFSDSRKIVVWDSTAEGDGRGILARRLDASNSVVGSEFVVNSVQQANQIEPDVAVGNDDRFVIIWVTNDSDGNGIATREFNADGIAIGPETIFNLTESNDQVRPAIAGAGGDTLLTVWNSSMQDGSSQGVYGRQYTFDPVQEPEFNATDSQGSPNDQVVEFTGLAFGDSPVTHTVTVINTGNSVLNISNVQLNTSHATIFSLNDASPFSLAPGASRQLNVTLDPVEAGQFYGVLELVHDDGSDALSGDVDPNPYIIEILASIDGPPTLDVTLSVSEISEGNATGAHLVVTRRNADLYTDLSISIQNSDSTEAIVPPTVLLLAGQQSVAVRFHSVDDILDDGTVAATFTATATGFQSGNATVLITDNDPSRSATGVSRGSFFFFDLNANGAWDGTDNYIAFGALNDRPIVGDWDGDGFDEIGVYRGTAATFYLDVNGNGLWDGLAVDRAIAFGALTDVPIVGDWNGDGVDQIGVYRPSTGTFYRDMNGNGVWDGAITDSAITFGAVNDRPVVGDWNGDGVDGIGVFRNGVFYLDATGDGIWNGVANGDFIHYFGAVGDAPIAGDWNGDGRDNIGVHRGATAIFYLDASADGAWSAVGGGDLSYAFGAVNDMPIVGNWRQPAALLVSGDAAPREDENSPLTVDALSPIVAAAREIWAATELTAVQQNALHQISVHIADLSGGRLGQAIGATITIDVDAAGYGWFIDETPDDNEEFELTDQVLLAAGDSAAAGQVDLLTVVLHEIGHVLGLDDHYSADEHDAADEFDDIMAGLLPLGVRRLPSLRAD